MPTSIAMPNCAESCGSAHYFRGEIALHRGDPAQAKPYRVGRSRTGLGLFATAPIRKHALIVEYSGPRIATAEAHARERAGRSKYMFELNSRWSIDGGGRDNIGRYANHACRPNAESVVIRGKVYLKAIRRIMPGEEITYDYGPEYVKLFFKNGCRCATCRGD